jgi:hypothetical protein
MKRLIRRIGSVLLVLGALAFAGATPGCDYGYAAYEDPASLDHEWTEEQHGLRGEEGAGERLEQQVPCGPDSTLPACYVPSQQQPQGGSGMPVHHPDPKPWKGN